MFCRRTEAFIAVLKCPFLTQSRHCGSRNRPSCLAIEGQVRGDFRSDRWTRYDTLSGTRDEVVRRREFIAALGTAAAWPITARTQQAGAVRRIGFLLFIGANDPETKPHGVPRNWRRV